LKVTKLTVGRCRRAKPPGEDAYYEVEVEVEGIGELENAKTAVQAIMDDWLNEPEPGPVGLDPESLDGLPWKSFSKKGELAEKGEAGWLFADAEGAEELVKALKTSKESCVRLAGCEYLLSGKDGKFVKRLPSKPLSRRASSRKVAGADEAAQPARSR
jgi:hypothetical protein